MCIDEEVDANCFVTTVKEKIEFREST